MTTLDTPAAKSIDKPVNIGMRIGSMILDHLFMTVIMMVIVAPVMIFQTMQDWKAMSSNDGSMNHETFSDLFGPALYLSFFAFSLYFSKDCIRGRSFAKRILKLQVVNNKTKEVATPLLCFFRNLTIMFWPVEVIVTFISPSRRLGDFIAGTRIENYRAERETGNYNISQIILSLVFGAALMYAFFRGMLWMVGIPLQPQLQKF